MQLKKTLDSTATLDTKKAESPPPLTYALQLVKELDFTATETSMVEETWARIAPPLADNASQAVKELEFTVSMASEVEGNQ